jgi:hypothetical protein
VSASNLGVQLALPVFGSDSLSRRPKCPVLGPHEGAAWTRLRACSSSQLRARWGDSPRIGGAGEEPFKRSAPTLISSSLGSGGHSASRPCLPEQSLGLVRPGSGERDALGDRTFLFPEVDYQIPFVLNESWSMNWLEVTRPQRICSGVRLETSVTSYLFCSNPRANCSPD